MTFEDWCSNVRDRFEQTFGYVPSKAPTLVQLDRVRERIMRCGVEARRLDVEYDDLPILAHHTLIMDDVRAGRSNSYIRYA